MTTEKQNLYLEIVITQKDEQFKATCPSFPKCKGIGENEDIALKKLCASIGRYLAKASKKMIEDILLSKKYTEVVLDPKARNTTQHRVFNFDPNSTILQENIMVKLDAIGTNFPIPKQPQNDVLEFLESFGFSDKPEAISHVEPRQFEHTISPPHPPQDEDFLFGVQLSLN